MSASLVTVSELHVTKRLDPEYYQPRHFAMLEKLRDAGSVTVESFAYVTDGIHGSPEWIEEGGVMMLSAKCVKDNAFALTDAGHISQEQNRINPRTQARLNDVLLSSVGTIGNAAVVCEDILPAHIDRHLGIIRINKFVDVDPYYLATFFNSEYGRFQTLREATGNVQLSLFIEKIKTLLVPISEQYNLIGSITRRAYEKYRESESWYVSAQSLLAAELGLDKLVLPTNDIATRRASDVNSVARIDAEYFHPQKEYMQAWLADFPGNAVDHYYHSVRQIYSPPKKDTGRTVLNFDLTDALRYFVDETNTKTLESEIGSIKKRLQLGDVIVSRLRSYLKEISVVEVPHGVESVGSSEFIVLRQLNKQLHPEALMIYLRSKPVQVVLKWSQDGSNHPRFQEEELLAVRVPARVLVIQDEIRKMIRAGVEAHRDAQRQLAEAKAEVERMIEEA